MTYQEDPDSSFTHDGVEYALNPVLKLVRGRKVYAVPMRHMQWNIEHAQYDEERVATAVLGYPLIVVVDKRFNRPTGYVVLDGTHRLIKAHRAGRAAVSCVFVTLTEIEAFAKPKPTTAWSNW